MTYAFRRAKDDGRFCKMGKGEKFRKEGEGMEQWQA